MGASLKLAPIAQVKHCLECLHAILKGADGSLRQEAIRFSLQQIPQAFDDIGSCEEGVPLLKLYLSHC